MATRFGESRDWGDYAQRTARYGDSASGDRQVAELGKYRQQWEKQEGRAQVQKVQEKAQKIGDRKNRYLTPRLMPGVRCLLEVTA